MKEELYEGQRTIQAGKLEQSELLQLADEAKLEADLTPEAKAIILHRMACRAGHIAGMQDNMGIERSPGRPFGSGEGRVVTFRLMLTPEERKQLNDLAEAQGQTPSQYVRDRIFKI